MRHGLMLLTLGVIFLAAGLPAQAQGKWELSPFAAYETSGTFPLSGSLTASNMRANSGVSYGTFLDYSLAEGLQAELLWNRNSTSYSAQDINTGTFSRAYDSNIDTFTFGFAYLFRSREAKFRPYGSAGLGFTHDSNSNAAPNPNGTPETVTNQTRFTFGVGGGVKYFPTRHVGLRGDLRLLAASAGVTPGLVCDQFGCFQSNVRNYLKRGNFTGGLIFRF
jgi:opacity protein-like surface antigen